MSQTETLLFPNVAAFRAKVQEAIRGDSDTESGAIILLHIENYAIISDIYGKELAEGTLVAATAKVASFLGPKDEMARLSADNWGIYLAQTPMDQVAERASSIRLALQRDNAVIREDMYPLFFDIFIGGTSLTQPLANVDAAINKANAALKHAIYTRWYGYMDYQDFQQVRAENKARLSDVHCIQSALVQDRLCLAFQPIISAASGKVDYYECLLRLRNEKGELQSAGKHIIMAETMGLIDEIDAYVFGKVFEELLQYPDLKLSMNISGGGFVESAAWMQKALKLLPDHPGVASRLVIEVTETAFQRNLNNTAFFLTKLRKFGCQIALDDFGVGYTSFLQLKQLDLDIVKVDGAFVKGLGSNHKDDVLVQCIINIGKEFGLKTVAEFVETQAIADKLIAMGIDGLQGFYFGKGEVERPWLKS